MSEILTEAQQLQVLGEMSFAFIFNTLTIVGAQSTPNSKDSSYLSVHALSPAGHEYMKLIRRSSVCGFEISDDYEWDQWKAHPKMVPKNNYNF